MNKALEDDGLVKAGLDHIDQGLTVIDRDLRIVAWNRRFIELQDFPESIVYAGADFGDLVRYNAERGEYGPGDTETLVAERIERAREFVAHDFERQRPNGLILRITGWPLPQGGFATIYTDVTAQKRREADLERRISERTAELSRSRERLRLIADEVPAGIAYLDAEQRFQFVNARFAAAYGCEPDALLGLPCHDVLNPETMAASQPHFDRAKKGEMGDFDMKIRLPDGRELDIRTFLRPERALHGRVPGFYVLSINTTRQRRADAALLQAQKMDALGALSSGVAHDFNNLLMVILGNLLPLSERVDASLAEELIDPAIRAARRGADLTKRLLAVARRQTLEPRPTDIDEVVSGLAKLLRPILPQSVELRIASRGAPRAAFVDPAQLETALLNLAINARDAMKGRGVISILTEDDPDRDMIRIVFEDDGPGVPPDIRERVFEPFFTTKAEGQGAGLGLSMVYGFVEQSRGHIAVGTAASGGARFEIGLPAADNPGAAAEAASAEIPAAARNGLALLVEDQAEVRAVVRRDLVALGYPVIEAATGSEALDVLHSTQAVTLLITDISMPGGMTGVELAEEALQRWPELGVVLMTGQQVEQPKPPGALALRKPFDRQALGKALETLASAAAEA